MGTIIYSLSPTTHLEEWLKSLRLWIMESCA